MPFRSGVARTRRNRAAILLAVAATLVLAASPTRAAPFSTELQLRSQRHSDFSSLDLLGDLDDRDKLSLARPRAGRNLAYIDDEARLGLHTGDWAWSLLARSRATLMLGEQTIRAAQHATGTDRTSEDAQWQTDARLRGFRGVGLEARRDHLELAGGWKLGLAAQALALTGLRERSITGELHYRGSSAQYGGTVDSSERSERLDFPFRGDVPAIGVGLLFSADAAWHAGAFALGLGVRDVGVLHWRALPSQTFTASSDTARVDDEGFLVYRPLLQGQNRQGSITVAAPAWWTVHADWRATPAGTLRLSADVLTAYGALPAVRWTQDVSGNWTLMAGWRLHERRLSVGVAGHGFSLELGADRLGGGAHSRAISLAWRQAW